MRIVTAAIDTAAGAVLVASERLPVGVSVSPVENVPNVQDASGQRLKISGIVWLELDVGGFTARIRAWVVPKLPVAILLGTPFINQYVEAILPRERLIKMRDPE